MAARATAKVDNGQVTGVVVENNWTVEQLITERQKLKLWLEGEEKCFADFCKPHKERMALLDQQCMAMMQEQGIKSLKTDVGTAIITQRDTPKILDGKREDFLDWCLENWDQYGAMLQIGTPKAEEIRNYMDANNGALPPNVEISTVLQFSVRRA